MARRLNPKHDAQTREKIKTSQLVNRLTGFALGDLEPKTKKPIEMSPAQVNAALGLLKKVLPDLSSAQIESNNVHNYVITDQPQEPDRDTWLQQHKPESPRETLP